MNYQELILILIIVSGLGGLVLALFLLRKNRLKFYGSRSQLASELSLSRINGEYFFNEFSKVFYPGRQSILFDSFVIEENLLWSVVRVSFGTGGGRYPVTKDFDCIHSHIDSKPFSYDSETKTASDTSEEKAMVSRLAAGPDLKITSGSDGFIAYKNKGTFSKLEILKVQNLFKELSSSK